MSWRNPTILYKRSLMDREELTSASQYFPCYHLRTSIPKGSQVIARYSALPDYWELEQDLQNLGSNLINTYSQHVWIANFDYYEDLKEYTFPSWTESQYPYSGYDGPLVIKGRTNSKKYQWRTKMFANNRVEAIAVASELANDSIINAQGLIYRKYIPLKTLEEGLNGLKFTNEFRFFFYKTHLLSHAYYWSEAEHPEVGRLDSEGLELAHHLAKIAAEHVNFFVLDLAEKESGGWILVEINDGQQSGLSMNNPKLLYENLSKALKTDRTT